MQVFLLVYFVLCVYVYMMSSYQWISGPFATPLTTESKESFWKVPPASYSRNNPSVVDERVFFASNAQPTGYFQETDARSVHEDE